MRSGRHRISRSSAALGALMILSGCQTELYTAMPEQEANEMLALLLRGGMSASKVKAKDGTDTILVEEKQFATAVETLHARGYPKTKFSTVNDVFQPSGLIASPIQEQARFLWALGQELSRTVSQIDGVLTARVQVVLPDNDLLKRDPTPSSASVFIRYDDSSQVTSLVSQIKMLVANSVQGLNYDKVSVVLVPVPHVDAPPRLAAATPEWQIPTLIGGGAVGFMAFLVLVFRRRIGTLLATTESPLPEPAD
jgi:type III secretion protein J